MSQIKTHPTSLVVLIPHRSDIGLVKAETEEFDSPSPSPRSLPLRDERYGEGKLTALLPPLPISLPTKEAGPLRLLEENLSLSAAQSCRHLRIDSFSSGSAPLGT